MNFVNLERMEAKNNPADSLCHEINDPCLKTITVSRPKCHLISMKFLGYTLN